MFKLMIVDDDEFIRSGLQHLLSWDELGIVVVGEAESGRKALEVAKETRPHIVITDIRMPNGDGLELIGSLRAIDPTIRFVVLSGYDDFDYARKALQLGVEDYLLKPIDEDELKKIMSSCCEQLEKEIIEEQLKRESFELLRNDVMQKWMTNRSSWYALEPKLKNLGINLSGPSLYQVGIVAWRNPAEGKLSETEQLFRSFSIHNALDEAMTMERKGLTFVSNDKQIVCLFLGAEQKFEAFAQENLHWLNELGQRVADVLKTPWYSTLGSPTADPESVYLSYEEAYSLQQRLSPNTNVLTVDMQSVPSSQRSDDPMPSSRNHDGIVRELISGSSQRWGGLLEQDFEWVSGLSDALSAAKYVATEWTVLSKQALKQIKHDVSDVYFDQMLISDIFKQESVAAVKNSLFSLLYEAEKRIRSGAHEKKNPLVRVVEQYLQEHFHEELTLQILSLQFHVNNVYLGRLFKEETGQLFSDYLNKLRIDKAKELLANTSKKAADIGLQVGFLDPNYFYRKFKQATGLSPTEFRSLAN